VDGQLVAGHAWYELGELRRLQGRPGIEEAFERATAFGHSAQPGLALYRLSQGNTQAADAGLRQVLTERQQADERLVLLPAVMEVCLASGRIDEANDVIIEMAKTARTYPTTAMRAILDAARGALALSEDRPAAALQDCGPPRIGGGNSAPCTRPPRSASASRWGAEHSVTTKARGGSSGRHWRRSSDSAQARTHP